MFFKYKDYVKNSMEYQEMLITMRLEVIEFMENFHDDPRYISGWGHGYFCEVDGARLIYNPDQPLEHHCSICGKIYTDYIYSSYFTTMYRNEAVMTAVKAAILYKIDGKIEFLNTVKKIIGYYAEHYHYFPIHAKTTINCSSTVDVGGAGKIMPQGLNEAIIAIRFLNALEIVREHLSEEWLLSVKNNLFVPMYQLLLPQKMHIHNIPIWLNSAFGIMGLFFDEKEWIEEATKHQYNIYEQLSEGLTESGFWYEGSIHYNFFALEGLMAFYVFCDSYGHEIPEKYREEIKKMLFAAYNYAFDNDIFPNPSDGWPNISLKTYSYVYFMACKVFGDEILLILRHITEGTLTRGRLPLSEPYYYNNTIPLEQLLFAADYKNSKAQLPTIRKSVNFTDYNCALLRNERINVFLKYGHQTKSHAHPDKMNIEIVIDGKVLTKDLSNSGYNTKICNQWNRTIGAHNTCAMNGQPTDITKAGKVLFFDENRIKAQAEAYEGVLYTREIQLLSNSIHDIFQVEGDKDGVIDWFFHFDMPLERGQISLKQSDELKEYPYFMEVNQCQVDDDKLVVENELVKMTINLGARTTAYLAKTYNNPADKQRDTLVIRKYGSKAEFVSILECK